MISNALRYWLAALYLEGVGPQLFLRWLQAFQSIEALFQATSADWQAAGIPPKLQQVLQQPDWQAVEADLAWGAEPDHHLLCFSDDDYPEALKAISSPPLLLFIKGNKQALLQPQMAMVGARHATPEGLRNAEQFAQALATAGYAITSGLAAGVDAASHRGALLAKGVTIAICGTGLHHIYPRAHKTLAEEIVASGGALVSEFPLATDVHPRHFPRRNRIIAGLSRGVLVVQAALKSGSLITARYALEQGREVFAVPGSIHQPLSRGCHYLIREGAKLVETATDILEELTCVMPQIMPPLPEVKLPLSTMAAELLQQIDCEVTAMDVILLRSGLTMSEVSAILLTLELSGYVRFVPGGYIRTAKNQ